MKNKIDRIFRHIVNKHGLSHVADLFGKSEVYESWFFTDEDELTKAMPPEEEGVTHPHNASWESKRHPNGIMMWAHKPEKARNVDRVISNKAAHQKILDSLPDTHKQAYANMVRQVVGDPNRHFIPTEENGKQQVRARHLAELLSNSKSVKLDTSHPDRLTLHRESHTQGIGPRNISIHFPTKRKV